MASFQPNLPEKPSDPSNILLFFKVLVLLPKALQDLALTVIYTLDLACISPLSQCEIFPSLNRN